MLENNLRLGVVGFSVTREFFIDNPEARKVDVRLPGKGNSNSHGARPVHQVTTMIRAMHENNIILGVAGL